MTCTPPDKPTSFAHFLQVNSTYLYTRVVGIQLSSGTRYNKFFTSENITINLRCHGTSLITYMYIHSMFGLYNYTYNMQSKDTQIAIYRLCIVTSLLCVSIFGSIGSKKKENEAFHRIYRLRKSADIYIAKSKKFKTAQRTLERNNKLMNKNGTAVCAFRC